MKTICAWCGDIIKHKNKTFLHQKKNKLISHGMCDKCKDIQQKEFDRFKKEIKNTRL